MKQQLLLFFSLLVMSTFTLAQEKDSLTKEEKERREKNIQAGNPFKKYGYTPKIATLSDGKYLEFHDLDSVVIIGSVYYNRVTKKVIDFVERDMTNPDAQPLSDVRGRWLSPDPLSEEYSNWTPYNYVKNDPLRYSDPTGMAGEDFIDIKINSKDKTVGISITPAKGNDQVRIVKDGEVTDSYEYGENGSFAKDNSVEKINIGTEAMIGVTFKDYNKADTFFKFAAKSGYEFGLVDVLYSNSMHAETTVLTSASKEGVMASKFAYKILGKYSDAYVLDVAHSHPGDFNENNAGPSGFNDKLKPVKGGDRQRYIDGNKYDGRRPTHYRIYTPSVPNVEVKYNGEEAIRTKK